MPRCQAGWPSSRGLSHVAQSDVGGQPGQARWGGGSRGTSSLAWLSGGSTWFGSRRAQDLLPVFTPPDPPAFSSCRKTDPLGFTRSRSGSSPHFRQPGQNANRRSRAGPAAAVNTELCGNPPVYSRRTAGHTGRSKIWEGDTCLI